MMSQVDFPWYATFNSFQISEEKAIEIIVLENGLEEFLNQYQDMVIDKPIDQSYGKFLMRT